MLVIDRNAGEKVNIGDDIEVEVLWAREINGRMQVRLGFTAPKDVPIWRNEIYRKIRNEEGESCQE
jgi:carbon storage regulator